MGNDLSNGDLIVNGSGEVRDVHLESMYLMCDLLAPVIIKGIPQDGGPIDSSIVNTSFNLISSRIRDSVLYPTSSYVIVNQVIRTAAKATGLSINDFKLASLKLKPIKSELTDIVLFIRTVMRLNKLIVKNNQIVRTVSVNPVVYKSPMTDYLLFSALILTLQHYRPIKTIFVNGFMGSDKMGLGCESIGFTNMTNGFKCMYGPPMSCCNSNIAGQIAVDALNVKLNRSVQTNTKFVKEVLKYTLSELRMLNAVVLHGHSYGGSVVSRVAMLIAANHPEYLPYVQFITYGSLYTPLIDSRARIIHYMNPLDEFILSINKLQINDHAEMTKLRINTNPLLLTYVNNPHTKYNMKTTPTETPVNHNNIQLIKNFKQFMNDKAEQDLKRIYGK